MGKKLYREYDENSNLIKKECRKCGQIKTIDNFNKNRAQKDGYEHRCRKCSNNYYINDKRTIKRNLKNELYRKYDDNGKLIMKECGKCHKIKSVNEFHKDIHDKDGYKHNCKDCACKERHSYRKNNLEKERERDRNFAKSHANERNEYMRIYHINNKEKDHEKSVKYYKEKVDKAMIEIYDNVTKKLYPNNVIQYGIIYGVHCIPTDRWYIGQTKTCFKNRYKTNFFDYKQYELSENNPKLQLLQEDIEKYGQDSFEIFEVIDVAFSEKELDEKEVYYIDYYKAFDNGYNSVRGNIIKHSKLKRS